MRIPCRKVREGLARLFEPRRPEILSKRKDTERSGRILNEVNADVSAWDGWWKQLSIYARIFSAARASYIALYVNHPETRSAHGRVYYPCMC
jgi:hypothetical protein